MFISQPVSKGSTIALIPSTFEFRGSFDVHIAHYGKPSTYKSTPYWQMLAYWNESSRARPIISFGMLSIGFWDREDANFDKEFPNQPLQNLTYYDILSVTKPADMMKYTYSRLGKSRPHIADMVPVHYHPNDHTSLPFDINTVAEYDEQEHRGLLTNPNSLPSFVDGWYSVSVKDR